MTLTPADALLAQHDWTRAAADLDAHGNAMYRDLGEDDVMRVVEWAVANLPIDRQKITITGPSMGGIGAAAIPLRFPGTFVATAPLCGYHSYFVRRDTAGRPVRPWERLIAEERSNVSWAYNGMKLPMWIVHGTKDLPETNSGVLIDRYKALGYPLTAVHVPKTVDNDLAVTDNCPGFGSVAKYVATSMREAAFDVASMARTSTRVFVLEVMGRHAGWITAAVGMAEDASTPIPLVLLFPEVVFDEAKFVAAVDARVKQFGYCCVGVSEGLRNAEG